jgi:hypothetical protein
MVEAATGVNLWSEWAKVEIDHDIPYRLPPLKPRHAGVVISLVKDENPDTSSFNDPEIVYRMDKKSHVGFVVASDDSARVDALLNRYIEKITNEHLLVVPAGTRPVN